MQQVKLISPLLIFTMRTEKAKQEREKEEAEKETPEESEET